MRRILTMLAVGAAAMSVTGALLVPVTPAAAIPVFDATNYAQNLLQAGRALEQINHQIRSLQNEAAMLQNMARNLERIDFPQLERITTSLQQVERLMEQAQGIGADMDALDRQLRAMFPGAVDGALSVDRRIADARARLDTALDGFRQSIRVQARIAANVRDDAAMLGELAGRSQGAVGSLQAQQATNQLLALGAKQQLQIQSLLAAEFRSQAIERARRAQAEIDARGATRRFLGSGQAYTPR